ncbi:acyltransferase family protein [Rhodococcoides corynebacterioides]|uniref:Acyltransferase n=1 Tax=Rhodococcoides corynebacterioides TaxID=53972 RepID=A0ABS7P5V3_9NOCA|nr:acyltransferase family protein [Rhodococcus corynebacterioides]MBY6367735.1 acyltransferase [Rhodococcus corynebacterioides]MBY6408506.1 acyltransferase [Rhodococcus corynebacterioides]
MTSPTADVPSTRSAPPAREPRAVHRADLDGLRGLAIALVVVFHIWFGRVSGGVDVFLVLSGFFFTTMVLRRAESGAVSAVASRTARRLYPAMVVVLAAVGLWTVARLPFTTWDETTRQIVATLAQVQNWELAATASDYAAADASVSPLQHLWSMSVQVQFYVVVTLLVAGIVAAARRVGRPDAVRPLLIAALAVASLLSFVHAAHLGTVRQGWAYYDTTARFWELGVGALAGLLIGRVAISGRVRAVLGAVGLPVLCFGGFVLDGAALFPGPWASVPVGAALAVIAAGTDPAAPTSVTAALQSRPLLFLGSIAYPLYLWHWPILIAVLGAGGTVTPLTGALIVAASVGLAVVTRNLVERRVTAGSRVVGRAVVVGFAVLALTATTWQGYLQRTTGPTDSTLDARLYPGAAALTDGADVPDAPMRPTVLDAAMDLPQSTLDGCIADMTQREVITCTYGDPDADRTLALAGGSHAEHWLPALDEIGRARGVAVVTYLKMGCPLDIGEPLLLEGNPYPDCRDWSEDVLTRLADERPDWVVTTSTRPSPTEFGDVTPTAYTDVWGRLEAAGLSVIGIRDTPWLSVDGVPYRAADCLADGGDAESCGLPRAEVLAEVDPAADASAPFPGVVPVDFSDAVCRADRCRVVEGNVLIYHDSHHLSVSYVRSLVPVVDRTVGDVTRWW